MKAQLVSTQPEMIEADALAVVLFEKSEENPAPWSGASQLTGALVSELYQSGEFTGKLQQISLIHRPAGAKAARLLLVGGGNRAEFNGIRLRQAAGTAARTLKTRGVRRLAMLPPDALAPSHQVGPLVEGVALANYEAHAYKTDRKDEQSIEELLVIAPPEHQPALDRALAVADSQNFARTLVNEPGNRLTPTDLAARAREMAAETGLEIEVLEEPRMRDLGMGALLGVAQGSAEPPVMIVLRYRPEAGSESGVHLGLVGKAVTFDTGGISIKPAENMDKMKYDMAGGAAMLGAMRAIAALKPRVPVTAVIPSVENMPGSKAQRPGDVVTTLSGKTVEVLNTDAEGRLILADALTYAQQLGCTHLVDAATLTGSIVVALGHERVGLFANDDRWRERVLQSSESAGEKMWPMPLDEEYKDQLKSIIADLPNIGTRWGGSITAAMFLKQFADPAKWAHLDIAGLAWIDDDKPYLPKGPSGVGVRTFVELAMGLE